MSMCEIRNLRLARAGFSGDADNFRTFRHGDLKVMRLMGVKKKPGKNDNRTLASHTRGPAAAFFNPAHAASSPEVSRG